MLLMELRLAGVVPLSTVLVAEEEVGSFGDCRRFISFGLFLVLAVADAFGAGADTVFGLALFLLGLVVF